jgi:hypothetical protein
VVTIGSLDALKSAKPGMPSKPVTISNASGNGNGTAVKQEVPEPVAGD